MTLPIVLNELGQVLCGRCGGAMVTVTATSLTDLPQEPAVCTFASWVRDGMSEHAGICITGEPSVVAMVDNSTTRQ